MRDTGHIVLEGIRTPPGGWKTAADSAPPWLTAAPAGRRPGAAGSAQRPEGPRAAAGAEATAWRGEPPAGGAEPPVPGSLAVSSGVEARDVNACEVSFTQGLGGGEPGELASTAHSKRDTAAGTGGEAAGDFGGARCPVGASATGAAHAEFSFTRTRLAEQAEVSSPWHATAPSEVLRSPAGATPALAARRSRDLTLPCLGRTPTRADWPPHGPPAPGALRAPRAAAAGDAALAATCEHKERLASRAAAESTQQGEAGAAAQGAAPPPTRAPEPGSPGRAGRSGERAAESARTPGHASGSSSEACGRTSGSAGAGQLPDDSAGPPPAAPSGRGASGSPLSPLREAEARAPAQLDPGRLDALLDEMRSDLR